MTITEKKPLLIQIPGERTPNELPITASAVGYDFVQGNYLIYSTGSDSWVTAPPNTAPGGSDTYVQFNDAGIFGGVAGLTFNKTSNTLTATNLAVSNIATVSGSVILGDAASDVVYVSGSVTASNGLQVIGSAIITNGVKVDAGGLQVAGIVPGISAPYNNTPVVIDLASGQTYGPVIRSVAGQYNFAALSLDQNGTYLGGIYGIDNNPGGFGYTDGINLYASGVRKINFNINGNSVGNFSSTGLQVTGTADIKNGGLRVAGVVPGISAPYNNSPMIIDLAAGQTYGPVIRSAGGTFDFSALSFDQNGTYLGGIYGLANDPSIPGYLDGLNFATTNSRNLVFNINNIIIGKFSTSGLQVTGSINGSSTITAATGFSGSLTKLTDGTSYIIAGSGIGVATGSNGAITISATGGGGTPGGSNTQIQYNNSGSFGGVTNLTWDGSNLYATGSFKGNLDGTASYATNAATASYVQNAVSASYATVAVSLKTTVFNVALNGSAPGVSTNIGGIYIPASTTVTTKSLAYIGGSTVSEVAVLKLVPINSVTVSASWVVTGTLTSVSLSNPVTLGPGWYDLTLETGTVSQTAFGRGLYLTSGDI